MTEQQRNELDNLIKQETDFAEKMESFGAENLALYLALITPIEMRASAIDICQGIQNVNKKTAGQDSPSKPAAIQS